jgi:hypothetical protein
VLVGVHLPLREMGEEMRNPAQGCENGSSPRFRESSLEGRRSPRSSAGANLALPAWLQFLGGVSLVLAIRFPVYRNER